MVSLDLGGNPVGSNFAHKITHTSRQTPCMDDDALESDRTSEPESLVEEPHESGFMQVDPEALTPAAVGIDDDCTSEPKSEAVVEHWHLGQSDDEFEEEEEEEEVKEVDEEDAPASPIYGMRV